MLIIMVHNCENKSNQFKVIKEIRINNPGFIVVKNHQMMPYYQINDHYIICLTSVFNDLKASKTAMINATNPTSPSNTKSLARMQKI